MKILKYLVIGIIGLCVLLAAVGFLLPDTVHVERSTTVNAKPQTVYTVVNGFRQFHKWSPWEGNDPAKTQSFSGAPWGVGAKQSWQSKVDGDGSQEIIASVPNQDVSFKLVFAGFDSDNTAHLKLSPEGEGTRVVWTYDSDFKGSLFLRYFGLIMDKMLGPDYEKGLAQLKTLVESLPKNDFSGIEIAVVETQAMPILYFSDSAGVAEAAAKIGAAYGQVNAAMQAASLKQTSAPLAITRKFDEQTKFWEFDAAIAVDKEITLPAESAVKAGKTYAGWAIRATHVGPYEAMEPSYGKLLAFKSLAGLEDNGLSWEHYITDPASTPAAELKTHIYWPVK